MKKNETNKSPNRIQNDKKSTTVAMNSKRTNYMKTEENKNNRITNTSKRIAQISSGTSVKKDQISTDKLSETNISANIYALTEIDSFNEGPNNFSGSRCLNYQQKEIEEEKSNESKENYEIDDNSFLNFKSNNENENTDFEQGLNVDQIREQKISDSLFSEKIDFASLQPLETSPDINSICEKNLILFQKNGSIPDPSEQQNLIHYIHRQKVNAIVSNNFKEASKLQLTCQNLINAINNSQVHDTLKTRIDEIEQKIIETNEKIDELNDETKSLITAERYDLDQKKDEIICNQENELDEFERKWNNEEFLRKFTKPSSFLISKQSIQHSYILMKDFDRAEELKNEIESMEKLESKEAQNKAETEMLKEQNKLIEKHQNEIISFNQFAKRQIEIIKGRQETKLEPLIARKRKLEIECNSLKKLRANQINSPSLPSIQYKTNSCLNSPSPSSRLNNKTPAYGMRSNHAISSLESVMTPRTVQRYSSYKNQIVNPKLTLRPLGKIISKKDQKKCTKSKSRIEKIREFKI